MRRRSLFSFCFVLSFLSVRESKRERREKRIKTPARPSLNLLRFSRKKNFVPSPRVDQSPPYAFGQGLIVALSCGGVAAAAASAAALGVEVVGVRGAGAGGAEENQSSPLPLPPEASHAHWQHVVLPTLAAGGVGVASALLASLCVLPSLALASVERAVAVCLKGLGAALSSSSSRFFGAGGEGGERGEQGGGGGGDERNTVVAVSAGNGSSNGVALKGEENRSRSRSRSNNNNNSSNNNNNNNNGDLLLSSSSSSFSASVSTSTALSNLHRLHRQETLAARPARGAAAAALPPVLLPPHLAMRREPAESPGFEAWWDRLCAPVDAVEASSSSSSSSSEDEDDGGDGDQRARRRRGRRRRQGPDDDRPLPQREDGALSRPAPSSPASPSPSRG